MPKRRRLLNPPRKCSKLNSSRDDSDHKPNDREVRSARGRLMGALLEVLEAESSDDEKYISQRKHEVSDEDERAHRSQKSPNRQSYVLKLFDRSVDLSQFQEDSPLYPICRAWIANQPKANYKELGGSLGDEDTSDKVGLPPAEGPEISRIPPLLPEQLATSKDNINLDYGSGELPSRGELLGAMRGRWSRVRGAWLGQAAAAERRYALSQSALQSLYSQM